MHIRRFAFFVALLGSALFAAATAASTGELMIYVDPQAPAGGTGLSPNSPIADLADAQTVAKNSYAGQPAVRVEIAPGNYGSQHVTWQWRPRGPMALTIEGAAGGPRPVFDGGGTSDTWAIFSMTPKPSSNITIRHVSVRNFRQAIVFVGHDTPNGMNRNELVEDSLFQHVGGHDETAWSAYAVVGLDYTSDSVVRNNVFADIANDAGCLRLHAIYVSHHSSNNTIENNQFREVCGDVLKVRDSSNNNRFVDNEFTGALTKTAVVDSYCDPRRGKNCPTIECPSFGNILSGNRFGPGIAPTRIEHLTENPVCPMLGNDRFAR